MIRYNECYVNNDNDLKIIIKGDQESKKVKTQKVGYAPGFEPKNDSSTVRLRTITAGAQSTCEAIMANHLRWTWVQYPIVLYLEN
jgi:hypothetical protein